MHNVLLSFVLWPASSLIHPRRSTSRMADSSNQTCSDIRCSTVVLAFGVEFTTFRAVTFHQQVRTLSPMVRSKGHPTRVNGAPAARRSRRPFRDCARVMVDGGFSDLADRLLAKPLPVLKESFMIWQDQDPSPKLHHNNDGIARTFSAASQER